VLTRNGGTEKKRDTYTGRDRERKREEMGRRVEREGRKEPFFLSLPFSPSLCL
jgi:hypothetical protein